MPTEPHTNNDSALSAPSEAMPEVKRWHWTGQLCHFVDGYLIGTMEHSIFRSDSSPAVVLWDDYLALSARLRAVEGDLEHERKFRIIAETNESVEIQRAESATREREALHAACDQLKRDLTCEQFKLRAIEREREEMAKKLKEILEMARDREDIKDGPEGAPLPNDWMVVAQIIDGERP